MSKKPIGIFDSGVGGLTVANAVRQILPNEKIIYFGDTAHLPYGDKSKDTIVHYSMNIANYLVEQGCKCIVIACNSASANAYTAIVSEFVDVPVINVIDPVVDYVVQYGSYKHIGVIGTKSTVNSQAYQTRINERTKGVLVSSMATPLFVPMIEEGFIFDDISNAIIRNYLSRHEIGGIDSLILGCTHYPIIKNQINKFYNFEIDILDTAKIVAQAVQRRLLDEGLTNMGKEGTSHEFYVSDFTPAFKVISKMFFEEEIDLQLVNLWD